MSKHTILTEEEMSNFRMNDIIVRYIEEYRNTNSLQNSEMRILDWGCGRGRSVAYLRERGYDAYGVDIDSEPLLKAHDLFIGRGENPTELISVLGEKNQTKHPSHFFDFVFSWQVFEHLQDVDRVVAELGRITKPGGVNVHVFPGRMYFVEGHLFMPMIHWLPKNKVRKFAIHAWLLLGRDPKWPELNGKSVSERAQFYYQYSVDKTYYRSWRNVKRIFERNGFKVQFPISQKLQKLGLSMVDRFRILRSLAGWAILNFRSIELLATRAQEKS